MPNHRLAALAATAVFISSSPLFAGGRGLSFIGLRDFNTATSVTDDGTVLLLNSQGAFRWSLQTGAIRVSQISPNHAVISRNGAVITGWGGGGAFRYDGAVHPLPSPPGGESNNYPTALSADGSAITGWNQSLTRAWRWTQPTGAVTIAPVFSRGYDISRDGQLVVGASGPTPFSYSVSSGLQTYSAFNNNEITEFRGISGDGAVFIGTGYTGGSSNQVGDAFTWTPATGYVPLGGALGPVPYGIQTYFANAVNFNGTLIGGSQGSQRAWIWDPLHGVRDLRAVLVNEYHYDLTNWTLESVNDISEDGRYIVGTGAYFNGTGHEYRAFIAVIPTPGAGFVFTMATAWLVARRRRVP